MSKNVRGITLQEQTDLMAAINRIVKSRFENNSWHELHIRTCIKPGSHGTMLHHSFIVTFDEMDRPQEQFDEQT